MSKLSMFLFLSGVLPLCWGDTLTLKNGDVVEGTYLGGTARMLRMEVNGRVLTYDISLVNGLQFVGGPTAPPPLAEAPPPPPPPLGANENQGVSRRPAQSSSSDEDRPVLRRPAENPPQNDDRILRPDSGNANGNSSSGVEIPAGTQITVRMIDSVDSEVARLGDTFRGSLDEPVMLNGQVLVPRGADVVAKLVEDQKSGKIAGRAVLKITLVSIRVNDRLVDISTQDVVRESGSRGANSGKVIGGTAALGAIIGGIVGGGKGAAIGAGSGAAVGTGAQEVRKGQQVKIPSETRLVFTTSYAVRI